MPPQGGHVPTGGLWGPQGGCALGMVPSLLTRGSPAQPCAGWVPLPAGFGGVYGVLGWPCPSRAGSSLLPAGPRRPAGSPGGCIPAGIPIPQLPGCPEGARVVHAAPAGSPAQRWRSWAGSGPPLPSRPGKPQLCREISPVCTNFSSSLFPNRLGPWPGAPHAPALRGPPAPQPSPSSPVVADAFWGRPSGCGVVAMLRLHAASLGAWG